MARVRIAIVVGVVGCVAACADDGGSTGETSSTGTSSTGTDETSTDETSTSSSSTSETSTTGVDTTDASTSSETSSDASSDSSTTASACDEPWPVLDDAPQWLSETGLYADIVGGTLAPEVRAFEPRFPLWSDGAAKARWIYLPPCEPIDTADMDGWEVPVGTRLWKEFTRDGVRVETRLIARTGLGPAEWIFATYVWNGDDAERTVDGVVDALGTGHDVPPEFQCTSCHRQSWRVLGFSAIQLAHDGPGLTLQTLLDEDALTDPPVDPIAVPGDAIAQAALGTLHANCGNCHAWDGVPFVDLQLRLRTSDAELEDTDAWLTAVDVPTTMFECGGCDLVEPGDPDASAIVMRMLERGPDSEQMPPIATELVDELGVEAVSAWIVDLPPT